MNLLDIKNLGFQKEAKVIVNNLTFQLSTGLTYALIGKNGAGKSTVASILMGLEGYQDFTGEINFQGISLKNKSITERSQLGITLAWQEPVRFQGLLVRDYLNLSLKKDSKLTINDALQKVGLEVNKILPRAVDKTLSGGERKRIELAAIICMQPQLAILDEPDSGVDVGALNYIIATMDYLKQRGTTVLLITHNMKILKKVDKILMLNEDGDGCRVINHQQVVSCFKRPCFKCPQV